MKSLLLLLSLSLGSTELGEPKNYNEACVKAIADGVQLRVYVDCPVEKGKWISWEERAGWKGVARGVVVFVPVDDWVREISREAVQGVEDLKKRALAENKVLVVYNGLRHQPIPGMLSCSSPSASTSLTVYVPAKGELWKMVLEGSRSSDDIQREAAKYKKDIEEGNNHVMLAPPPPPQRLMDISVVPQVNVPVQLGIFNANININRNRSAPAICIGGS